MILKKAEINNVKSYFVETVEFNDSINLFIGPNGGGKSNLFEIVQGVVNNILFKHVTLKANGNRWAENHPHKDKVYVLENNNVDNNNLNTNIFDKHFLHPTEPSSLYLTIIITSHDTDTIHNIIANSNQICETLKKKVADADSLVNLLEKIPADVNFSSFSDISIKLGLFLPDLTNIHIADYSDFPQEQHETLNLLFELIKYLNVFHELSIIFPEIDVSPLSRYFGPHRTIGQPQSISHVNLSTMGNFDDAYSKGMNVTKESSPSSLEGSGVRLCQLKELGKSTYIDNYKKYLKKYLKISVEINKLGDMPWVFEYEIIYKRENGLPMKLSSGEKEFFNLISGLILSGIRDGVVLLDEPELHLHSQWQQVILDLIHELSEEFSIQFFIVTHSPKFVNQHTLPNLFRISMNDSNSNVIKPTNPSGDSETKDLVQFLNSTNNEKIFFTNKVILVEGLSDQLIFSKIIDILKRKLNSDVEVEIMEVGSKYNLFKFRKLLNEWGVDNYIIADLDYLREVRKRNSTYIQTPTVRDMVIRSSTAITQVLKFKQNKLREILCKESNLDNKSLVDLIVSKPILSKNEFLERIDNLTDYLITERSTSLDKSIPLPTQIIKLLRKLAIKEKMLILEKGEIEDYYSITSNKIENALEVVKTLRVRDIDPKIKSFFKRFVFSAF